MNYPKQPGLGSAPEKIRVGDLVWWNGGVCVGFVEEVMEAREDYERWGLTGPSIALTNLHPFEANERKHKQRIGFPTNGGSVVYSADLLEDEGVGLLSCRERSELEWAIGEAKARAAPEHRERPFCVLAMMGKGTTGEDWHFHFVGPQCGILESVVFPVRPNTRTEKGSGSF